MTNQKTILIVVIIILLVSNVFFGVKYFTAQKEIQQIKIVLGAQKVNENVLEFAKFFIREVLKAEVEVDFETRLKLENAVRNLDDEEILAQWQKFTESKTEAEAQKHVKNLLEMLVNKIK